MKAPAPQATASSESAAQMDPTPYEQTKEAGAEKGETPQFSMLAAIARDKGHDSHKE